MSEPAQTRDPAEPLWRPSDAAVAAANMTKFRTQVARDWQIGLKDTDALWAWSTEQVDRFWTSLWRSCEVIGEMGRPALKDGDRMPGAQFFPDARLNFADAFSQAMTSVNSTSASSSKNVRSLAKSSSDTSRPVIVMLSAYSNTARSFSSKSGELAYSFKVINFSSLKPSALPTAALMSCQKSQPFKNATRRLTIACIFESIKPEESSPLHMPRTARKIDGRRA